LNDTPIHVGSVHILYGFAEIGIAEIANQIWTQDSPGMLGVGESKDYFGKSLAAGDFNSDGYWDLAIGVPGESVGRASGAGAVQVLFGSKPKISSLGNQLWHQDSPGILGKAETEPAPCNLSHHSRGDNFGSALGTGDFNGDGNSDLAIGVWGEDLNSPVVCDAGTVQVLYGSDFKLVADNNQMWNQGINGLPGTPIYLGLYATSFLGADFNGDGYDELAIGAATATILGNSIPYAGAVIVLRGARSRLGLPGVDYWHQDRVGVEGRAETGDLFGVVQ
jgi:hypothetical protein